MNQDEARRICRENGATLSIRKRSNQLYVYVSRWLPKLAAQACGYKVSRSSGQQFDRYVCPLSRLEEVTESVLISKIASLPRNPNKEPIDYSPKGSSLAALFG